MSWPLLTRIQHSGADAHERVQHRGDGGRGVGRHPRAVRRAVSRSDPDRSGRHGGCWLGAPCHCVTTRNTERVNAWHRAPRSRGELFLEFDNRRHATAAGRGRVRFWWTCAACALRSAQLHIVCKPGTFGIARHFTVTCKWPRRHTLGEPFRIRPFTGISLSLLPIARFLLANSSA